MMRHALEQNQSFGIVMHCCCVRLELRHALFLCSRVSRLGHSHLFQMTSVIDLDKSIHVLIHLDMFWALTNAPDDKCRGDRCFQISFILTCVGH